MSDPNDIFRQVRSICNLIFEEITLHNERSDDDLWMLKCNDRIPNTCYGQTGQGFLIEQYYSLFSMLHTPYGRVSLGSSGSGDHNVLLERLKLRLGLTLHKKEVYDIMGCEGPWWEINCIDSDTVPIYLPKSKFEYVKNEEVKKLYRTFSQPLKASAYLDLFL